MSAVRPRHLAIGFGLFFGLTAYFAYVYARNTTGPWFNPAISLMIYQTTMIGGLIILMGLLAAVSFLPHFARSPGLRAPSIAAGRGYGMSTLELGSESELPYHAVASDDPWKVEDTSEDSELVDGAGYTNPRRAHAAAAVSAALSRMEEGTSISAGGTLMDRLSGIRTRGNAVRASGPLEPEQALVRLREELRPLLVAARDAGIDVAEVQRQYAEATSGREGDLAYRVRIVEEMKRSLESVLSERVSTELRYVLRDLARANVMTDQAHGAELTAAEAVALLDAGHYAAAFNRVQAARRILDEQIRPVQPSETWPLPPTPFGAFVGPALAAAVYVAIAAMLLPGVSGFLEANYTLNTGVILFLSYGWFGLVLYAILSIVVASRPPARRPVRWEPPQDDF